jgi:hypothetical protein
LKDLFIMARKSKSRDKGGQHIDRLREKAGSQGSDRWDWTNKTGRSFRAKGVEGQRHPKERPYGDIFK